MVQDTLNSSYKKKSPKSEKQKSAGTGSGRVEWKGYVNPVISAQNKQHYQQWRRASEIVTEAYENTLQHGFKLSVDYQPREEAYRASLFCQNPHIPEAGYCLSVFAPSYSDAADRVIYLHTVVAEESWSKWINGGGFVDDWDV